MPTRRAFLALTTAAAASYRLCAQTGIQLDAQTTRPNVAAIDRERILAAAKDALTHPPNPLPPIPKSPGTRNDFYSTAESQQQSDALLELTLIVPALAAAMILSREADPAFASRCQVHAAAHLDAWFVTPATRMTPAMTYAAFLPETKAPNPEGVLETSGLAEVALAIPFLGLDARLDPATYKPWFAAYLDWLTADRAALLARDSKDHLGSSWLLQAAAYARLTGNEEALADLRRRFNTVTIRAEIVSTGLFPHELTTPNPYRNSLFNLDLLAGAAVLLSTRFESLWDRELQDGPGLRAAIARHAPYIESRNTWPYPADNTHFHDLPCRRPALLFAARAYSRPEYAELWRRLTPIQPADPEVLRTFPIRQPLLWVTRSS
jgi:hypothetical protein